MSFYQRNHSIILAVFTYAFIGFNLTTSFAQEDPEQIESELNFLQKRITQLQKELAKSNQKKDQLADEIRMIDKRIAKTIVLQYDLTKKIKQQQQQLDQLLADEQKAETLVKEQKIQLGKQLKSIYMMGNTDELKLFFNQSTIAALEKAFVYYDYLNQHRISLIENAISHIKQLQQLKDQIIVKSEELSVLRVEKQTEVDAEKIARTKRKVLLSRVKITIHEQKSTLTGLEENKKELQKLLKKITEALADLPPDEELGLVNFAQLKGKLNWPTTGNLIKKFGTIEPSGQLFQGMLIAGTVGNPVRAIAHGRIIFADWLKGFGLLVIVDHGDGYMSLYAYNDSIFVDVGDWVTANDMIASLGTSGGQNQPTMYFELRKDGKEINPRYWFVNKVPSKQ